MIRFRQVNQGIPDEDVTEMIRDNPPENFFADFQANFFSGAFRVLKRVIKMRNIAPPVVERREKATLHFLNREIRESRGGR